MAYSQDAMRRKLMGQQDPRGPVGMYSRGANVYPGGSAAQSGGGPQFGRPPDNNRNFAEQHQGFNPKYDSSHIDPNTLQRVIARGQELGQGQYQAPTPPPMQPTGRISPVQSTPRIMPDAYMNAPGRLGSVGVRKGWRPGGSVRGAMGNLPPELLALLQQYLGGRGLDNAAFSRRS